LDSGGDTDIDIGEEKKSYKLALVAEAGRVKNYPPRAVAAGWAGSLEIRIVVEAGGIVHEPLLQKSSGYADIDDAALNFVGIAVKRTPVPEHLRSRGFDLPLVIDFNFKGK
jgi:TonB family protein